MASGLLLLPEIIDVETLFRMWVTFFKILRTHAKSVQNRGAGPKWAHPNLSNWQLRGGSSRGAGREKAGMEYGLQRMDLDAEQRLCREERGPNSAGLSGWVQQQGWVHPLPLHHLPVSSSSEPSEKVEVEDPLLSLHQVGVYPGCLFYSSTSSHQKEPWGQHPHNLQAGYTCDEQGWVRGGSSLCLRPET